MKQKKEGKGKKSPKPAPKKNKIEKESTKDRKKVVENEKVLKEGSSRVVQDKPKKGNKKEGSQKRENPPQITAKAYAIYRQDLTPLIEFNVQEKRSIASLTKLMTLIASSMLAQKYNLATKSTQFKVSGRAASMFGTVSELQANEWVCIEDLLHALILPSGNDAAMVLAENFGALLSLQKSGTVDPVLERKVFDFTGYDSSALELCQLLFVEYLNQVSAQIHLNSTVFTNSHGLDDQASSSTVSDVARLLKKISQIPNCLKVISTRQYFGRAKYQVGKKSSGFREVNWRHTNRLLWKKGYIGGKTGQTIQAGNCLASIYENQQKQKFLIVVLGSTREEDRFRDTEKLVESYICQ